MDVWIINCLRPTAKDVFARTGHTVRGDSSRNGSSLRGNRRLVKIEVGDLGDLRAARVAVETAHLGSILLEQELGVHAEVAVVDFPFRRQRDKRGQQPTWMSDSAGVVVYDDV